MTDFQQIRITEKILHKNPILKWRGLNISLGYRKFDLQMFELPAEVLPLYMYCTVFSINNVCSTDERHI